MLSNERALSNEAVESMLKAMEIISNAQLDNISYDKTIICTIVDNSRATQESYYTVSDGSVRFKAYVTSTEGNKYDIDDQVYVKIPNGDYSKQKIIEGYYIAENNVVPATYVSPLDTFLDMAELTVDSNGDKINIIESLTANGNISQIPIWNWQIDSTTNAVDDLQVNGIYNTLGIQANFKCLLDKYKICKGSYGLRLDLYVRLNPTSTKHIIKSVYLDSAEMFGNPYSFTIYANQSKTFDISKVGTVDGMTLYFYQNNDFEYYDNNGKIKKINSIVPNIFVKDVYIAFGVETSVIQDNTIKLYSTENSSFNYTSPTDSTNAKNLGFLWYNKTEDGDYIGFSDGIVDVETKEILLKEKTDPDEKGICKCSYVDDENNIQTVEVHKDNIINKEDKYYATIYTIIPYDELEYIKLSAENNRLMEQIAKDVPTDENGLDISASITEGENAFSKATKLIQVNLVNTLTDFYQRTKSLVGINETLSSNDYFNNATTGKVNIALHFGENIEVAYKNLIEWYKGALSAAAAIQKHQIDKTQPEGIKIVQVDENNTYTKISNLYTKFKEQYINNGFILKELYDTISFKYSAFQSIYDTYSIKIEKIFVELDDYFGLLENLLGDKEKNITSNNDPKADNIDEEFKYVFNKPIIKYTERDFSNMENRYCVYWYRYTPGYIDEEDKIVEDNWKRLIPGEKIQSSIIGTIIMPDNLGLPEEFNLIGDTNYFEKKADPENNHLTVYLDPNRQEEKFKVILFYNHEKYESNELIFTNLETVPDATTLDSADAIEITHSTNSMESYQTLYGSNNTLINQGHSLVNRKLRLHYNGLLGGDESLIGASIYWYVPRNATMLTVNVNKLTELDDNERPVFNSDYYRSAEVIAGDSDKNTALIYTGPSLDYQVVENLEYSIGEVLKSIYDYKDGFYSLKSSNAIGVGGQWISEKNIKIIDNEEIYMDGYACFYKQKVDYIEEADEETGETVKIPKEEDLEFEYRIKNYYVPTYLNNTIFCLVKKDNYEFETSVSMTFGTQGTSGTDYTILIQPAGNQTAVSESDILELSVQGFNYNNEEIPIEKAIIPNEGSLFNPTVKWKGPSVYNLAFVPSEVTDKNLIINSAEVSVGEQAGIYTYEVKDEETGEIIITEEYPNYCGMAEIVMGLNDSRYGASSKDLSVIYPIAWSADKYFIEGPTSIIYDSFGSNPTYYKESYKIYNGATNNEITNVEWKIRYFMQKESSYSSDKALAPVYLFDENNTFELINENGNKIARLISSNDELLEEISFYRNYMPKLDKNENKLIPSNLYIGQIYDDNINIKQYVGDLNAYPVVCCYKDNNLIWAQPIIITQNRYPNAMVNSWDGNFQIDEKSGTILSTMIGAGYKNIDNTYSGVLMGEIGGEVSPDNKTDVGVYGFHHGEQSFGLNIDGTAFFGKSGRGRILIDGNSSTIKSQSYENGESGMTIDLDDGFIDMRGTTYENGEAKSDGNTSIHIDVKSPYFNIHSSKDTDIIHIANDEYYLQSNDYKEREIDENNNVSYGSGMKIDLLNNNIDAYNFTIRGESSNEEDGSAGSYLLMSSAPELTVHIKDSKNDIDIDMLKVTTDKFLLQSRNWNDKDSGLQETVEVTMATVTTDALDIRKGPSTSYASVGLVYREDIFQVYGEKDGWYSLSESLSEDEADSQWASGKYLKTETTISKPPINYSGMQIDVNSGKMTMYKDSALGLFIDSNDEFYPFQLGKEVPGANYRNFRIGWDGSLYGGDTYKWSISKSGKATFNSLSINSGSFNGTIYASGGTIGGCKINEGSISGNGWSLTSEKAIFNSIQMGEYLMSPLTNRKFIREINFFENSPNYYQYQKLLTDLTMSRIKAKVENDVVKFTRDDWKTSSDYLDVVTGSLAVRMQIVSTLALNLVGIESKET